ncbi:MAG: TAXI family TRAP transporter solute-binding subunit [Dehalococcoidia bacterium]|nr:TAXI family TRAP transporter solute-binding subunit [Dehalococcoidia bacterium]
MRRLLVILLGVLVVGVLVVGCAQPAPVPAPAPSPVSKEGWPKSMIVGSGPVGGGLNMLAAGICPIWEKALGIPVTVSPGGMVGNIEIFRSKEFDTFFSASAFGKSAYDNTKDFPWKGGPLTDLRIAFNAYENPWFFIALKKSGLTKVSELKDKRIAFSGGAAVWDVHASLTLPGEGIQYSLEDKAKRDVKVTYGTVDEVAQMVSDGLLDAAEGMMEGLVPQPGIMKLMQDKDCVILQWTKDSVMKRQGAAVMPPAIIKKELLSKYVTEDFLTYNGGINNFSVRDSLPEDFVYQLVKIWYENLPKLAEQNPYWKYNIQYPEIITQQVGVPFHPGAIKYWKEKGMWKGG